VKIFQSIESAGLGLRLGFKSLSLFVVVMVTLRLRTYYSPRCSGLLRSDA
jgi:hypothetical protein